MKRLSKLLIFILILSVFMTGCYQIPFKKYRHEYSIFNFSGRDTYYCFIRNGKYYYTSDDGIYQRDLQTKKTVRLFKVDPYTIAVNDDYLFVISNNYQLTVINLNNDRLSYTLAEKFVGIVVNGKDIFLTENGKNGHTDYIKQDDLINGCKNMQRDIIKDIKKGELIGYDRQYSYYKIKYDEYYIYAGFNEYYNSLEVMGICYEGCGKNKDSSFDSYCYYQNLNKLISYKLHSNLRITEKDKANKIIDLNGFTTSAYNVMKDGNNLYLLAQKGDNIPPVYYNRYEMYQEEDDIFKIDAQTDKLSIIYRLKEKDGRIIGFRNNNVYIYKSAKITRYDLNKKTTKEIAKIKEKNHMTFEMCGDYIFVIGRDKNHEDNPNLYIDEKKTIEEAVNVCD